MKSVLLTIFVLLGASVPALAINDQGWDVGGPQVHYLSWCQQNTLMVQNSQGQAIPRFDCAAYGRVCQSVESKQGPYLIVSAACVDPRLRR